MSPRVVLIGAPGAGKSTVGALLANYLDCDFVDSDEVIVAEEKMSIADIFVEKSERYFRSVEKCIVMRLLTDATGVLALGGGSVMDEGVQQALQGLEVVWLDITLAEAVQRVGLNQSRPLLLGNVRSNMKNLLATRNAIYEKLATIKVDAANSPEAIVRLIAEKIATP
jgi:shikimate kinase